MADEPTKPPSPKEPEDRESPWVAYLTGKKVSAASFLRARAKDSVVVPVTKKGQSTKRKALRPHPIDSNVRSQFAETLAAKPERIERLIAILQASMSGSDEIRKKVVDLAESGLRGLNVVAVPDSPEAAEFGKAISAWMVSLPNRPLRSVNLQILLLALHIGRYRQLLNHDEALSLLASAFSNPKRKPAVAPAVEPETTPFDVLLTVEPSEATLSYLTTYFQQSKAASDKANAAMQAQREQADYLRGENTDLRATVDRLREEVKALQERHVTATDTIAELERKNVRTRTSYQHEIDNTKDRIAGVLEGQLTRWLETSLQAVRTTPPRVEVIEERLEDTLALIEKELQWLQPSV